MQRKKNNKLAWLSIACLFILTSTGCADESETTLSDHYTVVKGDLVISVKESGTIKALEKVDIRSHVEGSNAIVYLIKEGTRLTQEDVDNKVVLVELDKASLLAKLDDQEVSVNNAESSYKQANISLEIQRNENESSIAEGERTILFARMDVEKYLGKTLVKDVMAQYGKSENGAEKESDKPKSDQDAISLGIDYESLAKREDLGGGALQERRILESDIELANEEVTLARNTLEWTNKLLEKGYVTKDEAEADALSLKRKGIELERTQTELDLFMRYDFAKNTEKLLSDYTEAKKEMERIRISCKGKEDKALDDVSAKEQNLEIHQVKLEKYKTQIENCTIYATKPGLVVYANLNQGNRGASNPIQEGTSVKENQEILTIPDLDNMGVEVKMMEGSNHMIKKGMQAIVQIDRDETLQIGGEVISVSSVADSADIFRGNPQPTYPTEIEISDAAKYELKPGMSAKVTILVQELKDVISVPLPAIQIYKGKSVCYVKAGGSYKCVLVELGASNIDRVYVKQGLAEGDKILLREPRVGEDIIRDESLFDEKKEPAKTVPPVQKKQVENAAEEKADTPDKQSVQKSQGIDENQKPQNTDAPQSRGSMRKIMEELNDEEIQKFRKLRMEGKIDMKAVGEALAGKSLEAQLEYMRNNVLNK